MMDTAHLACQLQKVTPAATQGSMTGYGLAALPLRESSPAVRRLAAEILADPVAVQLLSDRLYRAVAQQVAQQSRWQHSVRG